MIKILLVDDDFLVRTFLSRLTNWNAHGYSVVGAAQDGEQALEMAQEYQPDIIITDISMPVMDGITLIRRLKKENNPAKIVVLSCHDDFEYVREAMKLGAKKIWYSRWDSTIRSKNGRRLSSSSKVNGSRMSRAHSASERCWLFASKIMISAWQFFR